MLEMYAQPFGLKEMTSPGSSGGGGKAWLCAGAALNQTTTANVAMHSLAIRANIWTSPKRPSA